MYSTLVHRAEVVMRHQTEGVMRGGETLANKLVKSAGDSFQTWIHHNSWCMASNSLQGKLTVWTGTILLPTAIRIKILAKIAVWAEWWLFVGNNGLVVVVGILGCCEGWNFFRWCAPVDKILLCLGPIANGQCCTFFPERRGNFWPLVCLGPSGGAKWSTPHDWRRKPNEGIFISQDQRPDLWSIPRIIVRDHGSGTNNMATPKEVKRIVRLNP